MKFDNDLEKANRLSEIVIGKAIKVHKELGPGLLESVYQKCLSYELQNEKIEVANEVPIPIKYKDNNFKCGFRADLILENSLLLELKTVEELLPIHTAQLLTYLKLTGFRLGLLINFNTKYVKDGIKRIIV